MADDSNEHPVDDPIPGGDPVDTDATDADTEATDADAVATEATEAKADADPVVDAERAARKAKADAVIAKRQATTPRRTVTSRRVTPKPGTATEVTAASKARDAKKTEAVVNRVASSPQPPQVYAKGPSPWWVPAIMFALLILGAALIVANYAGAFGDPSNVRLVLGLGLILGGIITATQYR